MKKLLRKYFLTYQWKFEGEEIQTQSIVIGIILLPILPIIWIFQLFANIILYPFKLITNWLNNNI